MIFKRPRHLIWLIAGLCLVLCTSLFVASQTQTNFFEHSILDSYTLQALAWREGRLKLDQDYPWLELAIYESGYYVSFPPVPTLPMLLLTFFFGADTPNSFMALLYFLGAYVAAFYLARRWMNAAHAAIVAAFAVLGGSALDIAVSGFGMAGAVWYQAQLLALLLTLLSFSLMEGDTPKGWAASLILIALAVGCRPFHALYVPWLLWLLYRHLPAGEPPLRRLRAMLPYIAVPALIAVLYGALNYARFGNPLEFGHSFLPEFVESGEPMFSAAYIGRNIKQLLVPPSLRDGALSIPIFSGFAFYLTSPLLLFAAGSAAVRAYRRKIDLTDHLLAAALLVEIALLLSHRTNGGWQYGARYLIDTIPVGLYLYAKKRPCIAAAEALFMGALILFNTYGTIAFHFS